MFLSNKPLPRTSDQQPRHVARVSAGAFRIERSDCLWVHSTLALDRSVKLLTGLSVIVLFGLLRVHHVSYTSPAFYRIPFFRVLHIIGGTSRSTFNSIPHE
jgi:hypothetical protein